MFEEAEWVEAAPAVVGLHPATTQTRPATAPPVKVSGPGTGLFEAAKPTLPGRLCACWGPGEPAVLSWIGMEGVSPYLKIRKLKNKTTKTDLKIQLVRSWCGGERT